MSSFWFSTSSVQSTEHVQSVSKRMRVSPGVLSAGGQLIITGGKNILNQISLQVKINLFWMVKLDGQYIAILTASQIAWCPAFNKPPHYAR